MWTPRIKTAIQTHVQMAKSASHRDRREMGKPWAIDVVMALKYVKYTRN